MLTRRMMMMGAGLAAAVPALARGGTPPLIIDGLTGISDPDGKDDALELTPRAIREYRESGLGAIQVTIGDVGNGRGNWDALVAGAALHARIAAANPALFTIARSAADISAARAAGRIAIVCCVQDTAMVGAELDRLDTMQGLGIRVVQLTYNLRNLSGDGALEPANAGLSRLGRATIARIEANRQLLDLSHGGAQTIREAIAAATRPMVISHTGCRALHDNPRNVWDTELKAVADKGGVVGIYWMPFLVANSKPMAADLVRHMTHAVNICGEDHVSIGTDGILGKTVIDDAARARAAAVDKQRRALGIAAPGEGPDIFTIIPDLDSHLRYKKLADALVAAGWPSARIDKVMGANLLRLYGDAWGG
ncbi:dipeptidase [Polymorphobacter fuscus]|uniref:Peptidase M19 n=1 Tax=Sandarakinorhabdus fusca TaxID=1439888 RepID=A0A7C9KM29_9SPHN|nr:membrane dipeptidase [Polymorphobacter fuscus]KAB7646320.1 peptidase M19 [Polymorphobacter fuscus]MQT17543.1 peptidase M19 [Polymorphobacter fuscus]NJC09915.1 membrane dipeptidase [Polymorphobacter fuscus]